MVFPSDVKADFSHSAAQYDVVSHPVHVRPVPEAAWVEDAPTTFPQQGWVDLSSAERGLCILARGLPEYEVLDTERREVAVTLLRAVGYLGAANELQTTVVGAGPNIATPEAQVQRKLTFSLSVLPHGGSWDQAEVWRQALAHANPARAYSTGMDKNRPGSAGASAPSSRSLLAIEGRNVVLSALKKAESGEALILRLYNPSEVPSEANIRLPFTPAGVRLVGLDEQPITAEGEPGPVVKSGKRVRVVLPPKKIITLKLDRK
jgi:alpha-mannosidase